jgi:hypothetical protein
MQRLASCLVVVFAAVAVLAAAPADSSLFLPIDQVTPGMVGVGRTVFAGNARDEFQATIIGVLKNAIGPRHDLILAKLEGGPLANTGVIAGMSGSPVFVDGKLIGAVSYALGSFPKEPLAGITPIGEMTDAVDTSTGRSTNAGLAVQWPASPADVMTALGRLATRAIMPVSSLVGDRLVGSASLAGLAPALRPIAAAMVLNGFDPTVEGDLRGAFAATSATTAAASPRPVAPDDADVPQPGDPIGMSLIRGDVEMGATGTITYVDRSHVYAFGHPFLNLGSASLPMTRAHVYTVLPSLDSSMKIATLGPVIGTVTQDRATAVGGTIGAGPAELEVTLSLTSSGGAARPFHFFVARDRSLTPLLTYVGILNAITAYERQTGVMSIAAHGTLDFGDAGRVAIDDLFSGDSASTDVATAVATPIAAALTNSFRDVEPASLDLSLDMSERQATTTIERVWLDTTRPSPGETCRLQVQLRDYRGERRTVPIDVAMPSYASGPLTLVVTDAQGLTTLEASDLDPATPESWPDVIEKLNRTRRNNRLYVRLLEAEAGTSTGGETLSGLPDSVQSALTADSTSARKTLHTTIVGAWEERLDTAVHGSRKMTITLRPR